MRATADCNSCPTHFYAYKYGCATDQYNCTPNEYDSSTYEYNCTTNRNPYPLWLPILDTNFCSRRLK